VQELYLVSHDETLGIGTLHAICKPSHHYRMSQADWPLLVLQPIWLLT